MNSAYEDYYMRLHRIVGHYLAIQAWLRRVDCLVLVHGDLKAFLGLKKIEAIHIKKFVADVEPWFPYYKRFPPKTAKTSTSSLWLSRIAIIPHLPAGRMSVNERINQMQPDENGVTPPSIERFSKSSDAHEVPSHIKIVSYLALLADGLKTP